MEVFGWIEPEIQPLFTVADAIDVYIRLNNVRFSGGVPQELEIKLVVFRAI